MRPKPEAFLCTRCFESLIEGHTGSPKGFPHRLRVRKLLRSVCPAVAASDEKSARKGLRRDRPLETAVRELLR